MKKPVFLIVLMLTLSISGDVYGQFWKQYADSGNVYSNKKNNDKAIEFYYKAKEALQKDSVGTLTYAQVCDSLGGCFYKKKQYKDAEAQWLLTKQIQEKQLGNQHIAYARTCGNLGKTYRLMAQFDKAESLFLEAKLLQENLLGKQSVDYATSCNGLGLLYKQMGKYEKAEPLLIEAKQLREQLSGKLSSDYANTCFNLGNLYSAMGNNDKAELLLSETMQIRAEISGKSSTDYANACNSLANLYWFKGWYTKAKPLYLEAKQIWEQLGLVEDHDYAATCNNLATLYKTMGLYEKAAPLVIMARQIWAKVLGKKHQNYATACDNLAAIYEKMGKYEEAEGLYLEAKQIRQDVLGKEHPNYSGSLGNLASFYEKIGQYEKSEHYNEEAKLIMENKLMTEHRDYAAILSNLGNLYRNMGQYEKAAQTILEAKKIRERVLGKEHRDYAISCNSLGSLYEVMGLYEKAREQYSEAKQIREKLFGKNHPEYATSCNDLAANCHEMKQYKNAELLYLEAKNIRKTVFGKNHSEYANSCKNLAYLYWAMHQPLKAEKEFKESFSFNEYNLNSIFQFTNEKEKEVFIKNISGEDDEAYSFYASEKIISEQPYTLSLFHRNLILSSSQALQKQLFYASDTAINNDYHEWMDLKKYLSLLYSQPINERKDDVAALEEKAGQLEKKLTRLSSGFKKQQQKTGWKDIQQKLQDGEASIEFVNYLGYNGKQEADSTYYIALVLRKDKPMPILVNLFEKVQLDSLLANTGNKTTNDNVTKLYVSRGIITKGDNSALNKSVYSLVWKPLEKELKNIKTIYFAPSGLLHRIAFAALPVNKNEVLSDRYKLIQLATTASVTDQTATFISSSDNLQLYGGINYDADSTEIKQSVQQYAVDTKNENSRSIPADLTRNGTFTYLAGTASEIKTIEEEAKRSETHTTLLSGINATEESFKSLNGHASPAVIHIATHGFFFPDPKTEQKKNIQPGSETGEVFRKSDNPLFRSGLLFAGANNAWQGKTVDGIEDGILTAYEVSNMYLPNTKLAVLSACETALGDIQGSEGVYGLQRAFKIAGAQNLVMSLWKVPDAETAEFMQLFYKNMFEKQSISDAFYHAQTIMKNKYRNDPYKWAAWILIK